MNEAEDQYLESLFARHIELRKELHRFVQKLDCATGEEQILYQDICVLLAQHIQKIRKNCRESYSLNTCQEHLDQKL
ncbi:hypothetical protein AAV35_004440 [Salimicrobium jeotgali]|uniref:Uncharacterized protein n=1 Tax=Salimicrobium jeotgali TaxID=1230341 RepID=K2G7V2_9BACI|nr:hypothetical protein [Salimicrobium jeotgali]AKG04105.1 hypothetical protein AAV35_004440 [Salimicrobium jeotgali]EKE31233.1 hypothetical protein MJ3_09693 [Salimicrobium jeotgali]MBM7697204.1 hypothetical protein [Salimicrobium jeotgali]